MKKLIEGLVDHAKEELTRAGLLDKDSDYDGMLGNAVLELATAFAKQGHSGCSAGMTLELFNRLAKYQTLTEISNDPEEWNNVSEYCGPESKPMWQSRRNPALFSNDGGKTYYDVDNPEEIKIAVERCTAKADPEAVKAVEAAIDKVIINI